MYNAKRRWSLSSKLQQNWEGPYAIVKKRNDVIYRVQRSSNAKPKAIYINRLALYRATDHSSVMRLPGRQTLKREQCYKNVMSLSCLTSLMFGKRILLR
ncbi:hypothetical protein AVEN_176120-1 [Araneus ventricosus]|uniref:Integrase p58-like C-terminal domain-containing protein n=1 Tax=Araneus ventricosus TaxID=182803 RepID=A0A4Y2K5E7_ARAVE|nr:hypothetical protein AVEN_176120-1 [Araneus ventricosus]